MDNWWRYDRDGRYIDIEEMRNQFYDRYFDDDVKPESVACEHCGEIFEKYPDDEDICPECERKICYCENCDERLFIDDENIIVDGSGRSFCSGKCREEYMLELAKEALKGWKKNK